jgi:hypothetical protein
MSTRGWANFTPEHYMRDEERTVPSRVTTPDHPAGDFDTWRSTPAVRREYERGLLHGWIGAMAFYAVVSAVLILAFRVLGGAA